MPRKPKSNAPIPELESSIEAPAATTPAASGTRGDAASAKPAGAGKGGAVKATASKAAASKSGASKPDAPKPAAPKPAASKAAASKSAAAAPKPAASKSRAPKAAAGDGKPAAPVRRRLPLGGSVDADSFASDSPGGDEPPLVSNLTSHFLLAMPGLDDPNFHGAVVLVAEHNERGALGLMVNRPGGLSLRALLERLEIEPSADSEHIEQPVLIGGPVQSDRGFVLHDSRGRYGATLLIGEHIKLTTSKDVLEAVARGRGPGRLMVTLGYAGWGPGQLEDEIAQNIWLTVPADPRILYDVPVEERFARVYAALGIDPLLLAPTAGHG